MDKVTVYSPESPIRHPIDLVTAMARDTFASRGLAWRLFVRDVSAQYRQSIFGYLWAFVPPLVASLPFIYLRNRGIVGIGATPIPYAAYAMIGTIIWQSFVDAVNAPLRAVLTAKPMLVRINLPREAILFSALMQVIFQLCVRLILLVAVFLWFRLSPAPTAPLALLGIAGLILFGFMIGVLVTPFGVLYNDVQQVLPVLTSFLMLLTAVVYPPPTTGFGATFSRWNPLTPLVAATREWMITGPSVYAMTVFEIGCFSAVMLILGWFAFRVAMPHLIARIGS